MNITTAWFRESASILCCSILLFGASACTEGVKDGPGMENPNPPAMETPNPPAMQQEQPAPPSPAVSSNQSPSPQETPDIETLKATKVMIVDVRDGFYGMTRNEIAKVDPYHYLATMSDEEFIKWATRPNGTDEEIRNSVKEIANFSKTRLSYNQNDIDQLIHKHSKKKINNLVKQALKDREKITETIKEYNELSFPFEVNVYYDKVRKGLIGLDRAAENTEKLSSAKSEQEINDLLAVIRKGLDTANDNMLSSQGIAAGILEDHSK
ncbi:MAG: hypothetical protein K6G50_04480 [bacterium]|nr:hypothetical protein [bacterium]